MPGNVPFADDGIEIGKLVQGLEGKVNIHDLLTQSGLCFQVARKVVQGEVNCTGSSFVTDDPVGNRVQLRFSLRGYECAQECHNLRAA